MTHEMDDTLDTLAADAREGLAKLIGAMRGTSPAATIVVLHAMLTLTEHFIHEESSFPEQSEDIIARLARAGSDLGKMQVDRIMHRKAAERADG